MVLWPASWLVTVFERSLFSVLRILVVSLADPQFNPDAGASALLLMSTGPVLSCAG